MDQSIGQYTSTRDAAELEVIIGDTPRHSGTRKGFVNATVSETRILSSPGVPQKVHIELQLPEDVVYKAGDHLKALPMNDQSTVRRALSKFQLEEDTPVTIRPSDSSLPPTNGLPINTPLSAGEIFSRYLDLSRAATVRDLDLLFDTTVDDEVRQTLRGILASINSNTASVLGILEQFSDKSLNLSLGAFLAMLSPIQPRTYSFSSAPGWNPGHGTLTVNVVDRKSVGPNRGLASKS